MAVEIASKSLAARICQRPKGLAVLIQRGRERAYAWIDLAGDVWLSADGKGFWKPVAEDLEVGKWPFVSCEVRESSIEISVRWGANQVGGFIVFPKTGMHRFRLTEHASDG